MHNSESVPLIWRWTEGHLTFERFSQELLSFEHFAARLLRHVWAAMAVLGAELVLGVIGYTTIAHLTPIDALYNAAMLAGGQGPVDLMPTWQAKIWGSFYALFSGAFGMIILGLLVAPIWHRCEHWHRRHNHHQPT